MSDLDIGGVADADVTDALAYARVLILVLNYGYGVAGPSPSAVYTPTVAQRTCLATLGTRIHLFVMQLRSEVPLDVSPEAAGSRAQARGTMTPLRLVADLVEWPTAAGTCDPLGIIPTKVGEFISSADAMFPCPPDGLGEFAVSTPGIVASTSSTR